MLRTLLLLIASTLAGLTSLHAAILTFQFSGQANVVGADLASEFEVGDTYTFTVSYDTTTPNTGFDDTYIYAAISASVTVDATSGPWTGTWASPNVQIDDFPSFQRISFNGSPPTFTGPSIGGLSTLTGNVTMFDDTVPLPLPDGSLPTSYNMADWSTNPSSTNMILSFGTGFPSENARFSIDNVVVVPEPSTYATLAGLLALAFVALRRRKA